MAGFPGEEFFDPINEGLKTARDVKRKREEQSRADAELRLKQSKEYREAHKDLQEQQNREEYGQYIEKQAPAGIFRDRGIAAREVREGRSPNAGLKEQFAPDSQFWSKYKAQWVDQYVQGAKDLADPNADRAAIQKKQELAGSVLNLLGMKTNMDDGMRQKMKDAEAILKGQDPAVPAAVLTNAQRSFDQHMRPVLEKSLKAAGVSDDEIGKIIQAQKDKDLPDIFIDTPATSSVVKSYLNVLERNPERVDDIFKERNLQTNVFGMADSKTLKKFRDEHSRDMSLFDQLELGRAITAREVADSIEKEVGKPYGNIYGDADKILAQIKAHPEQAQEIAKTIKVPSTTRVVRGALEADQKATEAKKKAKQRR